MLSCAKQIWRAVIPTGGGPVAAGRKLGQKFLRKLAVRPTIHGELFSHRRVCDQKSKSVVKTGMKLEPFCFTCV